MAPARRATVLLACALLATATASAVTRTLVLRQGQAGYQGVRDTWVARLDWDHPPQYSVNYGQNAVLMLSRDGGENPLLRFDLAAIPANSALTSATLRLVNRTSSGGVSRKIEAFRVLKTWDEGTEQLSPIDAPGKHGATGDHAFAYYPGEGTNVPWATRGMAAGSDYDAAVVASAQISAPGPVDLDVTALVRSWVRGEAANHGLVLRDATGYADSNPDMRELESSQSADASVRPTLTVVYDPDTPAANAGPDQATFSWNGGPVTLDGSASHDRPGGNDVTLRFTWRVVTAAYGSSFGGATIGGGRTPSFTPDAAGDWEVELTVTNDVGSAATDRVRLRLLSIKAEHPRIFLTTSRLAALRSRAVPEDPRWAALLGEADDPTGMIHAKALLGAVTGQATYCDRAVADALTLAARTDRYASKAGDIALVYDWCHDRLSASDRATLLAYFTTWAATNPHDGNDVPGWGNYWPRWTASYALVGLATWGDTASAAAWLDEYRTNRFAAFDVPALDRIAAGGAWPEGNVYDWIANLPRVKAVEAWRSATGENLFLASQWFEERLGFLLLRHLPGTAEQWGVPYHPYPSIGDSERNRGTMANYGRITAMILAGAFPQNPAARQLQAYLAASPCNVSASFEAHDEFLFFDPAQATSPPTALAHLAAGTGTLVMRSGWPSGAADDDASPTHITFQCGDHFTYHQHYDQNAFTLFKRADLLVDSGVYSGDGLSYHDQNYYVRTVAHNTLVVLNPTESFQGARPDAESNDGGQRPPYPASRSPQSVVEWDEHRVQYETGDITRYEDGPGFTYALGDATAAYNNPTYSQSTDTGLAGNTPKVTRFQRELVYLRGAGGAGDDYLVLLDRVGVTDARYSGAATKLLFHTLAEPSVDGQATTVSPGETLHTGATRAMASAGAGRVTLSFLAPAARQVRVVGGRGVKAFWVNGTVYDWQWSAAEPQPRPTNDFEEEPYGEWRLELEPGDTALDHVFLTVIHPTATAISAEPEARLITGTGLIGAEIGDFILPRVALFSANGNPRAGLHFYTVSAPRAAHTLFDFLPGIRYRLTETASGNSTTITLTPDAAGPLEASAQGVLAFTTGEETPRIRRHLGR